MRELHTVRSKLADEARLASWTTKPGLERAVAIVDELLRRPSHEDQGTLWDQSHTEQTDGRSHTDDPITSKTAARRQLLNSGTNRHKVLVFLAARGELGATGYEIGASLRMLRTAADTRRKELAEMGLVAVKPNALRPTDTGSPAQVHVITDEGRARLATLA